MPHITATAPAEPARERDLDFATVVLGGIDCEAQRLPARQQRAFMEQQYGVWCRRYGAVACADPTMDPTEYIRIVIGISARITRLSS